MRTDTLKQLITSSSFLLLLSISTFLNVALGHKVNQLRSNIETLKAEERIHIGETAPQVVAEDMSGTVVYHSYADSGMPTVLYVFSPSCSWCDRNLANIASLIDQTTGRYSFLGLSLDKEGLADYALKHHLTFDFLVNPAPNVRSLLHLGGTPTTFVLDQTGKVLKMWNGAYTKDMIPDIERFFGIRLPGLVEIEASSD